MIAQLGIGMKTWIAPVLLWASLTFCAGAHAASPQPESCAAEHPIGHGPLELPASLDEPTRIGISSAIYLALKDETGANDWPERVTGPGAGCEVIGFQAGRERFTIYGARKEDAPPRWARSESGTLVFLALGPSAPESYDWYSSDPRPNSIRIVHPIFYLVVAQERLRYVVQAYDGAPSDEMLAADMARAVSGELPLLAIYDAQGDAVTIDRPTASGLSALLFGKRPFHGFAQLFGADGHFFSADLQMRGSGFTCSENFGSYTLGVLAIVNSEDRDLDLACRFQTGKSWMSVFVTRYDNGPSTASIFAESLKSMRDSAPPRDERRNLVVPEGPHKPPFGASWTDKKGQGQGVWLARRGRYYIQTRATFQDAATARTAVDAVYEMASQIPDSGGGP